MLISSRLLVFLFLIPRLQPVWWEEETPRLQGAVQVLAR